MTHLILSAICRLWKTLSCYESNWHTCHVVFLVIVQLFAKHSYILHGFCQHTVTLYSYLAKYITIVHILTTTISLYIFWPTKDPLHNYFAKYSSIVQIFHQITFSLYSYFYKHNIFPFFTVISPLQLHCTVIMPNAVPL